MSLKSENAALEAANKELRSIVYSMLDDGFKKNQEICSLKQVICRLKEENHAK